MPSQFTFQTVNDIRCGTNCINQLADILLQKFSLKQVMVVTDKVLVNLGKLNPMLACLSAKGIGVTLFDQVQADPPEAVILAATEMALEVDVVIGFGGGSSMDTAKLVAVLAKKQQALQDMYGVDNVRSARLPLVQIPTTAGTGSEVTPISVVTTGEFTKLGVVSPVLYADLVMLDAALLVGMPASITAETGIDAMVHAIEAYTSVIKKNPLSDNLAKQALSLMYKSLPLAFKDGKNLQYRQDTLLAAMLAGQAFANAPVAGVHALAYPLGGIYHLAHGLTNALMLPHLLEFNVLTAETEYAELAEILLDDLPPSKAEKAACFIKLMHDLSAQLGLNKPLRAYGIKPEDLPMLAAEAMKQTRLLQNNPRPIDYEAALNLYQRAW